MVSESLFTTCSGCGKGIAKTAKACPQCGCRQRKLSAIHWIGIIFLSLIMIGMFNANDTRQDQVRFIEVVTKYVNAFSTAKNELQQSALRDQRKQVLSSLRSDEVVTSWVGTISQLKTTSNGNAILYVEISPNITIHTWNNTLSDFSSNTFIPKGSPLYADLMQLSAGQNVQFSGSYVPSDIDHIKETSLTIRGAMTDPEFLFRFRSINTIN